MSRSMAEYQPVPRPYHRSSNHPQPTGACSSSHKQQYLGYGDPGSSSIRVRKVAIKIWTMGMYRVLASSLGSTMVPRGEPNLGFEEGS
jgi:hypothetical protein